MEIYERVFWFLLGSSLFICSLMLLFIDPVTDFMWKIHCIRVDNKLERLVRDYMKECGWKIVWDIKTFRRVCISRRGFRIPLKDAYSYIRKHGDPMDIFYWGDVFDLWNRTSEEM